MKIVFNQMKTVYNLAMRKIRIIQEKSVQKVNKAKINFTLMKIQIQLVNF